jgi:hypothetical protein
MLSNVTPASLRSPYEDLADPRVFRPPKRRRCQNAQRRSPTADPGPNPPRHVVHGSRQAHPNLGRHPIMRVPKRARLFATDVSPNAGLESAVERLPAIACSRQLARPEVTGALLELLRFDRHPRKRIVGIGGTTPHGAILASIADGPQQGERARGVTPAALPRRRRGRWR